MPRILIVDDEATIRFTLCLVLESAGYKVTTAGSASEARQRLTDQFFDLVLTDIRMETPTAGFDVLRAARHGSTIVPVALLTGFPLLTSEWRQAGADAFFVKGSDSPTKILEWISNALAKRSGD